jgi:hypothetical protein
MNSIFYAELNEDNHCKAILQYEQTLDSPPSNYRVLDSFDESFLGKKWNGSSWEEGPVPTAEDGAKAWRDQELQLTDYIVPLSDHPQRAAYMTYRTALRNWPSTSDFPATKPVLG